MRQLLSLVAHNSVLNAELLSFFSFFIIAVLSSPLPSIGFLFREISRFDENKDFEDKECLIENIIEGDKKRLRCVSTGQLGVADSCFPS